MGLTALRNAAFPDKSTFYSGFFNTSIAMERIMKLIVVTDHMLATQGVPPTVQQLKAYGHNLFALRDSCAAAASRNNIPFEDLPPEPAPERALVVFLSDFSTQARYYNLDALTVVPTRYTEPLVTFERILNTILELDVPRQKVQVLRQQASDLSKLLKDSTRAIHHGMDGELLTLEDVLGLPLIHHVVTPYMMVRLFRVLTPLIALVSELGHRAFYGSSRSVGPIVPLFEEFFVHFGGSDADIRRKKRWP